MQGILDKIADFFARFLPKGIMRFVRKFLSVEFFTFAIIGIVNTFTTSIVATALDFVYRGMLAEGTTAFQFIERYRVTFIAGYIASLVLSFFLNTYFTFREKPTLMKFIKFPISYIPNFLIQYLCVWIFTAMHLPSTLAYVAAALLGVPITFLTMRIFVYKKK